MVLQLWKEEIDKGNVTVAVFLDLKRAFEAIDRTILLRKLNATGIGGIELQWYFDYLSDRKQRTKFNDFLSEERAIENGVPQGSCSGPILFILYINDIQVALQYSTGHLFADDSMAAFAHKNVNL